MLWLPSGRGDDPGADAAAQAEEWPGWMEGNLENCGVADPRWSGKAAFAGAASVRR